MTREQYEKLKEWIKYAAVHAVLANKESFDRMIRLEKELDKLMFPKDTK